jgi:hypothetical protein
MKEQEPAVPQPVVDLWRREPRVAQLRAGNHPVLRGREGGDRRVIT